MHVSKCIAKVAILVITLYSGLLKAQNPQHLALPNQQTVPVDETKRATGTIKLQPGFKYGAGTSGARLTLQISSYPSYVEPGYEEYTTNCANPSLASTLVGETEGNFAVSPNGNAVYSIPVKCSPGTAGMEPNLSITYMSGGANGMMGLGWNLSGISAITRTSKSPYYDTKFEAVKLNLNDPFALDGSRLILKSGSNGTSGSTYGPEIEDFSTVTAQGQQGIGPQSFVVVDKNGTTTEYGSNADARLTSVGGTSVLVWMVSKVTDQYGNFMLYHYTQLNGELVISSIEYTGNGSMAPYNEIVFEYMQKTEKQSFYEAGQEFRKTQLLKSITARANGELVKKYNLQYEFSFNTLLTKITEVNKDRSEMNPTTFCWNDPYDNSVMQGTQNMALYSSANDAKYDDIDHMLSADMNGDGFSDVITLNHDKVYEVLVNPFVKNYQTNTASGFSSALTTPNTTSYYKLLGSHVYDTDFDNRQEVYNFFSDEANAKTYYLQKISTISVNNTDQMPNVQISQLRSAVLNTNINPDAVPSRFYYDKNDYTADGDQDELIIDGENIILTSSGGTESYALDPVTMIARPLDFDGDGSMEVAVFENHVSYLTVNIMKFDAGNFLPYYSTDIMFGGNTTADLLKLIGIGDFNGDGKTDLTYMNYIKSSLSVCFSTGNGLSAPVAIESFTPLLVLADYQITCPDINANGINDIVITQKVLPNTFAPYQSYVAVGNTFIKGPTGSGKFKDNVYRAMTYYYMVGGTKFELTKMEKTKVFEYNTDFNGDGNYDFISLDGTHTQIVNNNSQNGNPKFVTGIFTGMGRKIEVTYCNTATRFDRARNSVYLDSPNQSYTGALMSFKPSNFVASHVEFTANASNIVYGKRYVYQGAIFHKYGKGFLGFDQFSEIDLVTLIGSQSSFQLNTTNFEKSSTISTTAKFSYSSMNFNGTGLITAWAYDYNAMISESKASFQHTARGSKRFFIAPSVLNSRNFLNSTASETSFTYDLTKDGNVTQQLISYGWPGTAPLRTEQADHTYQQVNTLYKPLQTKTRFVQGSNPAYEREANYTFDGAGRLTQVVSDPLLGNQSLVTVYSQYNQFGIPTKVQVSSGNILPRESQVLYDATGRFVIKTINPKGHVEEYTYDAKYGTLLQGKDISGLISKYSYDGMGRLIKSQLPDNTTNTVSYEYTTAQSTFQQPVCFSKTVQNAGQPAHITFYDAWGHELRSITENEAGLTVYTDQIYDNKGLIEASEPHYALGGTNGQAGYLVNKYTRDTYQRPLKTETFYKTGSTAYSPKGLFTTHTYNNPGNPFTYIQGFVSTADQNGKTVLQENNAIGQTTKLSNQVVSNSGPLITLSDLETSDYTYHSNGKPLSATVSYSNISDIITHTFDYDALGNQSKLVDPTVGTVNYGYDALGEMIHRDDALGSFDYSYDVLGRVTQKVGSASGTTTYQYVTAAAGREQLQKITGPNVTTELTYDYLGRPLSYKESLPASSKVFTSSFEYDAYSRLSQYTYPGGYITKYAYTANGAGLHAITDDNNTTIWQSTGQDATGHITNYAYGNGIATTNEFSELHYLKSIEHGSLHKQDYDFNPLTGNLSKRTFSNYATSHTNREAFNFDPLDRLRKSEQLNPANNVAIANTANNITIDIKGNILQKDDAGDYNYSNPLLPYSLTQITNPTANISTNALGVTINDIRKTSQLSEAATGKEMNFTYGNDDERIKVDYLLSSVNQYSRYYQANYEREETATDAKEWTYIYAPTGLAAVFYKPTAASAGQLLYALSDHLGSPVLLTNGSQQIQEEYSFDAWGRRRNPNDWSYSGFSTPTMLHRGYTMHEHIDEFKLINMNGRVYDAVLGRFMQPDNQVQDPGFLQTFNKYAYVFNNPLSFTDPSGWAGGSGNYGNTDGVQVSNSVYASMYYGTGTSIIYGQNYYNTGNYTDPVYQTGPAGGNSTSTSGITAAVMSGMDNAPAVATPNATSNSSRGGGGELGLKSEFNQTFNSASSTSQTNEDILQNMIQQNFANRLSNFKIKVDITINDQYLADYKNRTGSTNVKAVTYEVDEKDISKGINIVLQSSYINDADFLLIVLDHELTHAWFLNTGEFNLWSNKYNRTIAIAISEMGAYTQTLKTSKELSHSNLPLSMDISNSAQSKYNHFYNVLLNYLKR